MKPILFTKAEASFIVQMLQSVQFRGEDSARIVVSIIDKLRASEEGAKLPLPSMTPVRQEPEIHTLRDAIARIDPGSCLRPGAVPVTGELVTP